MNEFPKLEFNEYCECCKRNKITLEVFRPALKASGCPTHGMEHFFEGMCIECGIVPPDSAGAEPHG